MLKLKMQAERDIPCERETESVSNNVRGRPSNRAKGRPSNRVRGRPRARGRRRMRQIARLRGRMRVFVWKMIARLRGRSQDWEGDWESDSVGKRWFGLWVTDGLSVGSRETSWARIVLELHELGYQAYFLNSRCHVRCQVGIEKWGTWAHQARVP